MLRAMHSADPESVPAWRPCPARPALALLLLPALLLLLPPALGCRRPAPADVAAATPAAGPPAPPAAPTLDAAARDHFAALYTHYRDQVTSDSEPVVADIPAAVRASIGQGAVEPQPLPELVADLSVAIQYRRRHKQAFTGRDLLATLAALRALCAAPPAVRAAGYEFAGDAFVHGLDRFVEGAAFYRAAAGGGLHSDVLDRKLGYAFSLMAANKQLDTSYQAREVFLLRPGETTLSAETAAALLAWGQALNLSGVSYERYVTDHADSAIVQDLDAQLRRRTRRVQEGDLVDDHRLQL